ncbi:Protein CBG27047 [Caenorhabditis briggsae]|uniref:Protein CBG27047 n=1 Tax=Caenorhabditis briggsae TaxID=6238 RepID=B6IMB1_CAEBR|nr:Protein CBG27047 [Caenorhabditis briggsae]CAS01041.1 Protein CBG27047 [Caenorhabditis briggsae]
MLSDGQAFSEFFLSSFIEFE